MEVNDDTHAPTALPSRNNSGSQRSSEWAGFKPGLDVFRNEKISDLDSKSSLANPSPSPGPPNTQLKGDILHAKTFFFSNDNILILSWQNQNTTPKEVWELEGCWFWKTYIQQDEGSFRQ
jgi:hypothetical protein